MVPGAGLTSPCAPHPCAALGNLRTLGRGRSPPPRGRALLSREQWEICHETCGEGMWLWVGIFWGALLRRVKLLRALPFPALAGRRIFPLVKDQPLCDSFSDPARRR